MIPRPNPNKSVRLVSPTNGVHEPQPQARNTGGT